MIVFSQNPFLSIIVLRNFYIARTKETYQDIFSMPFKNNDAFSSVV